MGHVLSVTCRDWKPVISGRFMMAACLGSLLLRVVGCAAAPISTTPAQTAASPSSIPSPASASSTPSAEAAGLTLFPIAGYTYTTPPAAIRQMTVGLDASGMVSAVVGRGVKDRSGAIVAAIVLSQYKDRKSTRLNSSHANISYA